MSLEDVQVGRRVRFRSPDQSLDQRKWKYGVISAGPAAGQTGPLVHSGTVGRKVVVDTGETHPSGAKNFHLIPPAKLQLVRA